MEDVRLFTHHIYILYVSILYLLWATDIKWITILVHIQGDKGAISHVCQSRSELWNLAYALGLWTLYKYFMFPFSVLIPEIFKKTNRDNIFYRIFTNYDWYNYKHLVALIKLMLIFWFSHASKIKHPQGMTVINQFHKALSVWTKFGS